MRITIYVAFKYFLNVFRAYLLHIFGYFMLAKFNVKSP